MNLQSCKRITDFSSLGFGNHYLNLSKTRIKNIAHLKNVQNLIIDEIVYEEENSFIKIEVDLLI